MTHANLVFGRPLKMYSPSITSVLFVGRLPQEMCADAGTMAHNLRIEAIEAEYDRVSQRMKDRGWHGDLCIIAPDKGGLSLLRRMLQTWRYDCVVLSMEFGMGNHIRFLETLINHVQVNAPNTPIAFTTTPEEALDAAARWIE